MAIGPSGQENTRNLFLQQAYVKYWRELCLYLRARFGMGPPDPQDFAQHAFAQLMSLEDPTEIHNPRAFLYRTAINAALDHRRIEQSRARLADRVALAWGSEDMDELAPDRVVLAKDELARLESAVLKLTPRERNFLLLNRLEGISFAEIARRAGVSASGVRLIVEQALAQCEAALYTDDDRPQ